MYKLLQRNYYYDNRYNLKFITRGVDDNFFKIISSWKWSIVNEKVLYFDVPNSAVVKAIYDQTCSSLYRLNKYTSSQSQKVRYTHSHKYLYTCKFYHRNSKFR